MTPLWFLVLDSLLLGDHHIASRGKAGLGMGVAGLLVLLWPDLSAATALGRVQFWASLSLVGGSFSWALGSVLAKKWKSSAVDPFSATAWQIIAAGLANFGIAFALGDTSRAVWSARGIAATLYLVVFGSWVGYTAYIWLLGHVPTSKVSTYAYVNPVVAVFLGWLVLHERVTGFILAGSAIVVASVALVTSAPVTAKRAIEGNAGGREYGRLVEQVMAGFNVARRPAALYDGGQDALRTAGRMPALQVPGDFMLTCVRCGRELPSSAADSHPFCRDCDAILAQTAVGSPPMVGAAIPAWKAFSLTKIIFGINLAVFVAMVLSGVSVMQPTNWQLIRWGANWGPLSLGSQPWRMLTSNYVHIGIIHIFINMWCLWNLGQLAERIFERWTYLLVYTATGIGGSLASLWWHPLETGAGASGAIFGLAGALIAALYLGNLPISKAALKPTLRSLLAFAGYNLFFGLSAGIDNAAHLGGLGTGLALGAVLSRSIVAPPRNSGAHAELCSGRNAGARFSGQRLFKAEDGKDRRHASLQDPVAALNHGNFGQAIPGLKQAAESDPDSASTHNLLGLAYVGARQPDAAIASFQEACV